MRAITEERAGTDMVFRVSVPANKADAVRRHLESMMMLLGAVSYTHLGARGGCSKKRGEAPGRDRHVRRVTARYLMASRMEFGL